MNKAQCEAAKRVIDSDATGSSTLIYEVKGEPTTYCALGGLGKAAGMTDRSLRHAQGLMDSNKDEHYGAVARAIKKRFGIEAKWVTEIFSVNDDFLDYEIPERRRALKKLMDKIYKADQKASAA